jgi:hypothetical protein
MRTVGTRHRSSSRRRRPRPSRVFPLLDRGVLPVANCRGLRGRGVSASGRSIRLAGGPPLADHEWSPRLCLPLETLATGCFAASQTAAGGRLGEHRRAAACATISPRSPAVSLFPRRDARSTAECPYASTAASPGRWCRSVQVAHWLLLLCRTMRFGADRCKSLRHLLVPRADFAWDNRVEAISSAAKAGVPGRLRHDRGYASALSPSVADL